MVKFSESFLNFMRDSDSRVAQFIWRVHYWHRHMPVYDLALTNKDIDYLTLRPDGTISYLPSSKPMMYTEDGRWRREGRQNGRPSKVIRKILTKNAQRLFKDADFEAFANMYKAACDAENMTFKIHPKELIPEVYCHELEPGEGSLNGSCMNGDRSYVSFYKTCPDVSILAMYNQGGQLAGRALVWRLEDGRKLMDRIYVAKDHYYELFLNYADDNDMVRKYNYKSYSDKCIFVYKGERFDKYYKFSCDSDYGSYPYIDTFTYGGDGWISNDCSDSIFEYTCTGGGREGDRDDEDYRYCEIDEEDYHMDEMTYIERGRYRGCYVRDRYAVSVGRYTWWEEDDEIVEVNGEYYEKSSGDVVYCEMDYTWYLTDDCVQLENGEWCLECDSVIINDKIYHKDDQPEQDTIDTIE